MKRLLNIIHKGILLIEFFLFYLKEVLVSNLRVAADVLTPSYRMRPELLKVNITGMSDRQVLVLSNLVTMTPGSLSIDVNVNRTELLIHVMYVDDPTETINALQNHYRERINNVF